MPRANLRSKSVPRADIDLRVRDARLRLHRMERLLVPAAAPGSSWLRRALCLFSFGGYRNGVRGYRTRGPLRNRRPSRMPQIHHGMIGAGGSF
jgi:hypothetical protein